MSAVMAAQPAELAVTAIPDSLLSYADQVVRYENYTLIVQSNRKHTLRHHLILTRLHPDAEYKTLSVNYNEYSSAKIRNARLYDAGGEVIKEFKKRDIQDIGHFDGFTLHSDARYLMVDLGYPQYPYTLEVEYEVDFHETFFYEPWFPCDFNTSVESATYAIFLPSAMELHAKWTGLEESYSTQSDNGGDWHRWTLSDWAAIDEEPLSPDSYDVLPYLFVSPDKFEVANNVGSMSTWESFGKFLFALNADREKLSPEMQQKVNSILVDAHSREDSIAALYRYLQGNMRYVSVQLGIGGWQSFSADYVEKNKFGDCKALSHFMKGMLNHAGIEAHTAIVNSGRDITLPDKFAVPFFNHMILFLPEDNTWLECTSHFNPPGYIGKSNAGKKALLVMKSGGELVVTPSDPVEHSKLMTNDSVFLSVDKPFALRGTRTYFGACHEAIRIESVFFSQTEQQERFLSRFPLVPLKLEKLTNRALSDSATAICNYALQMESYFKRAGDRLILESNALYPFQNPLATCDERMLPVVLDEPYHEENTVIYSPPPGYRFSSTPKTTSIEEIDVGEYSLEYSSNEKALIIYRKLNLHAFSLPGSACERVSRFFQKVRECDRKHIILVPDK